MRASGDEGQTVETVTDWDDAYSNGKYISGAAEFPERWAAAARSFRDSWADAQLDLAYGPSPRERLDLFRPDREPRGLVVFVHGGYWKSFDKSTWSHLAVGPVARGWAVAIPSYSLCPEVTIPEITRQIGAAVTAAAALVEGPLRLAGHSAGGHLVSRLCCEDSPLAPALRARLTRTLSISGLSDLRPLLLTEMRAVLRLDEQIAATESPVLRKPLPGLKISCSVGDQERPEFRRQNRLLGEAWSSLGATVTTCEIGGRHHFTVVEDLADANSALLDELLR
jgi:acetyl esterase/lipase